MWKDIPTRLFLVVMAVTQGDVEQMKYWSMWLVVLAQWRHLVDHTKLMHGHLTYSVERIQLVSEYTCCMFNNIYHILTFYVYRLSTSDQ